MHLLHFYLNGQPVTLDFSLSKSPSPLCSVLHYLRDVLHLKGTKEVCGKGDCGACTVILVSAPTATTPAVYRAVDSCLLRLPDLDGKHLLTIEAPTHLLDTEPIRNAFLKYRGSQCGFCSPGMVLSTYAHLKNNRPFTREEIQRSLSGNLCRCTGYLAIYDAVASLEGAVLQDCLPEFPTTEKGLKIFCKDNVTYCLPHNPEEVSSAFQQFPGAKPAGGFTGSALVWQPSEEPLQVMDLSQVSSWAECSVGNREIILGATAPIETLRTFLRPYYSAVSEYLDDFAGTQIRNKATLGGSIADGSPVGDAMPFCMALKAQVVIWGPGGTRRVSAEDFTKGYRHVDLNPQEVVAQVILPLPDPYTHYFVYKQARRKNMDISTLSFAAAIRVENGKCTDVQLVYGGMAEKVMHASHAERFLNGHPFTLINCKKAGDLLEQDFSPLSDLRGGKEYRMQCARNLLLLQYQHYTQQHNGQSI